MADPTHQTDDASKSEEKSVKSTAVVGALKNVGHNLMTGAKTGKAKAGKLGKNLIKNTEGFSSKIMHRPVKPETAISADATVSAPFQVESLTHTHKPGSEPSLTSSSHGSSSSSPAPSRSPAPSTGSAPSIPTFGSTPVTPLVSISSHHERSDSSPLPSPRVIRFNTPPSSANTSLSTSASPNTSPSRALPANHIRSHSATTSPVGSTTPNLSASAGKDRNESPLRPRGSSNVSVSPMKIKPLPKPVSKSSDINKSADVSKSSDNKSADESQKVTTAVTGNTSNSTPASPRKPLSPRTTTPTSTTAPTTPRKSVSTPAPAVVTTTASTINEDIEESNIRKSLKDLPASSTTPRNAAITSSTPSSARANFTLAVGSSSSGSTTPRRPTPPTTPRKSISTSAGSTITTPRAQPTTPPSLPTPATSTEATASTTLTISATSATETVVTTPVTAAKFMPTHGITLDSLALADELDEALTPESTKPPLPLTPPPPSDFSEDDDEESEEEETTTNVSTIPTTASTTASTLPTVASTAAIQIQEHVFMNEAELNALPLPRVVVDPDKKFLHEPMTKNFANWFKIIDKQDIYDANFYSQVHLNFVGVHATKSDESFIISVKKPAENGKYKCMKTHKRGCEEFYIQSQILSGIAKKKLSEKIIEYLDQLYNSNSNNNNNNSVTYNFYNISDTNFPHHLRTVEKKHPQKQKTFKIAFLYSKGGETTLQHFFAHRDASPAYFSFLDTLGQKIELKGWQKYRGDIGQEIEQQSYYTEWNGVEVMFHVCIWMDSEQHRRLIGNDVVFIIYHDNSQPFDPAPLDSLGTVPQVFAVVQKHDEKYRLGFFSRPTIKPFEPPIPALHSFAKDELKDFLFTKVYNGYCQALSCPPMNRLFEVPRANTIAEIISQFPNESKKARKIRTHGAKKKLNLISTSIKDPLFLMVTIIRALPPANVKFTNGYFSVKILDQEQKTKVIKTKEKEKLTDALSWGKAEGKLAFNVVAVDPSLHFVKTELRGSGKSGLGDHVIAQVEIPFVKICQKLGTEQWLELNCESTTSSLTSSFPTPFASPSSSSGSSGASSSSAVYLQFDLVGPAAVLCPTCKLFLGALDIIIYKDIKYHARCMVCSVCAKSLISEEWTERSEKFFCRKCYGKSFSDISYDDYNNNNSDLSSSGGGNSSSKVVSGAASNVDKAGDKHTWEATTFKSLYWCGFCGGHMGLGSHGFTCSDCKYPVHKECKSQVPANCNHNPENPPLHSTIPSELVKSVITKTKHLSNPALKKNVNKDKDNNNDSPYKSSSNPNNLLENDSTTNTTATTTASTTTTDIVPLNTSSKLPEVSTGKRQRRNSTSSLSRQQQGQPEPENDKKLKRKSLRAISHAVGKLSSYSFGTGGNINGNNNHNGNSEQDGHKKM